MTADFIPVDLTSYYKEGWEKKTKKVSTCRALSSIFFGTIVVFSFECFLHLCQAVGAILIVCKGKKQEDSYQHHLRIQHIVEFPLVGFLLMHVLLTKEEIQEYTLIDKRNSVENDVIVRLTGAYRADNIMYTKVKVNSIICLSCCRSDDCPKSVTLGQAIIYPIILPYTKNFWSVVFPADSNVCTYLCYGSVCFCLVFIFSISNFFMNLYLFFVLAINYGDKLYLGRLLSDVPNFSMAISYIVNVEYKASAALSAAASLLLTTYYLGSMLLKSVRECRARDEAKVQSSFHEVYGTLTRSQAISLVVFQPFIMALCSWFYYPMSVLGFSCFADKEVDQNLSTTTVENSLNTKHSSTKNELVQSDTELSVVSSSSRRRIEETSDY